MVVKRLRNQMEIHSAVVKAVQSLILVGDCGFVTVGSLCVTYSTCDVFDIRPTAGLEFISNSVLMGSVTRFIANI